MSMSPREIVNELDRYIVGQDEAKKAVAIALRNRYRRSRLTEEEREEITPKNIIMQGPTGVGKTEIARRLAKLVKAPFIKVEATKFTEVGYVGRDVESMVRDLVECSIRLVKDEKRAELAEQAKKNAANKIIDAITSTRSKKKPRHGKRRYTRTGGKRLRSRQAGQPSGFDRGRRDAKACRTGAGRDGNKRKRVAGRNFAKEKEKTHAGRKRRG